MQINLTGIVGKNVNDILPNLKAIYQDIRVLSSGGLLTADHKPNRLNVNVDVNGIVTSYNFG